MLKQKFGSALNKTKMKMKFILTYSTYLSYLNRRIKRTVKSPSFS